MNNLPAQFTSLVGREREVVKVRGLLRRPEVRLLTLTGPGGIGKTRLGLQVVEGLLRDFDDEVFFVPLASISDPTLLASVIAQTVNVKEVVGQTVLQSLMDALRDKRALLFLDNFEQVLEASAVVASLLQAAPQMKVMVTSRAALRVYGEQEFPVPALGLPDPQRLDVEGVDHEAVLMQYPSVRLFVERASAVKPDFVLSKANASAVAKICCRLDGLPLAIELAAARVKLLAPQLLLERLDKRLEVLTGGMRGVPERQRTLRSTIDWSYHLLTGAEQALFRRLGVFMGGWTFEAAEAICSTDGGVDLDLFDNLESLLDKSLIRRDEGTAPEATSRFVMLQTIREYAVECLVASGDADVLRKRHAAYFVDLAETAEQHLTGSQQGVWFERLDREHDNLTSALQWAVEAGHAETAARLSGALWRFWRMRGHLSTGRRWLEATLTGSQAVPAARRLKVLLGAAVLAEHQADYERALPLLEESRAVAQELDDTQSLAFVLNALGNIAMNECDFARAQPLYEESLALRKQQGDKQGLLQSLNNLGWAALEQGDYERAGALLSESDVLGRQLGDQGRIARSLHYRGIIACERGDYATARKHYEESLALRQALDDKWGVAESLEAFAGLAALERRPAHALHLAGAATTLRASIGAPLFPVGKVRLDRWLQIARDALGARAVEQAWVAGRALSPAEALAETEQQAQAEAVTIAIDTEKQANQVAEITDTDYFQTLKQQAGKLRKRGK